MTDARTAELLFVCTSDRKGVPKQAVERAEARSDHGLVGDAHAGGGHRQLSLLAAADIDSMKARGLELAPGAFGENLVVQGVDLAALAPGSRLRVGEVELEITQVGKVCHHRCAIYHRAGDCIMPRRGLFARALADGLLEPGQTVEVLETVSPEQLQAAVVTVSDRCAAGHTEDRSGPAVADWLAERLKARVAWRELVADDFDGIQRLLKDLVGRGVQLICTSGGTGCTPRDITPEATRPLLDREVPGLAEAMRAASIQITPHAMLQRGVTGIRRGCLIVNLPGNPKAAVENLDAIVAALPHAIRHIGGDGSHPEHDRGRAIAKR